MGCLDEMIGRAEACAAAKRGMLEATKAHPVPQPIPDAEEIATKRNKKVTLMCYPEELEQIRANAEEMRLSLSDYIRQSTTINCLAERRANDIRDASLDLLGRLRRIMYPMLPMLQTILAGMPQGDERDLLAGIARDIVKAMRYIDMREDDLACSESI